MGTVWSLDTHHGRRRRRHAPRTRRGVVPAPPARTPRHPSRGDDDTHCVAGADDRRISRRRSTARKNGVIRKAQFISDNTAATTNPLTSQGQSGFRISHLTPILSRCRLPFGFFVAINVREETAWKMPCCGTIWKKRFGMRWQEQSARGIQEPQLWVLVLQGTFPL